MDTIKTQLIKPEQYINVEMASKYQKRYEMMEILKVVMGEIVTVQLLSLIMFVEMDPQHHQIGVLHAHLDTIKITVLIQNTEFQDEVMAIKLKTRDVMMATTTTEMAVAQPET